MPETFNIYDLLEGKALPIGTKRVWGGRPVQKTRNGWVYSATGKPATPPSGKKGPAQPPKPSLGSKVKGMLHKAWHTLTEPFVGAYHLATSKKARSEFKKKIGGAIKNEAKQTKALLGTLKKALTPGKKVSAEERGKAIDQCADLVKVGLIGTMYGHIASHGIAELLSVIASPIEEIAGVIIDKPLRRVTKKIFGHEHGILPTSFYGEEGEKKEALTTAVGRLVEAMKDQDTEAKALLEKICDAIFDEMKNEPLTAEDVQEALASLGVDQATAEKIASKMTK